MTKSKPVEPKPVEPEPVLAWCALNRDDRIRPGWCSTDKETALRWAKTFGRSMILVEIRPAPKRKGARK